MQLARKRMMSWREFSTFRGTFEREYAALGKPDGMALMMLAEPGNESIEVACFIPESIAIDVALCDGWARGPAAGIGWELLAGRSDPRVRSSFVPFGNDFMSDSLARAIPA